MVELAQVDLLLTVATGGISLLTIIGGVVIEHIWSPVRTHMRHMREIESSLEQVDDRTRELEHLSVQNAEKTDEIREVLKAFVLEREHADITVDGGDVLERLSDEDREPRAHDYLQRSDEGNELSE